MVSLFRAATGEDWTEIMYINMLGCENTPYYNDDDDKCAAENKGLGWFAAFYFVAFVIIGGLVLFSLFIGIICTSMEEVQVTLCGRGKSWSRCPGSMILNSRLTSSPNLSDAQIRRAA